MYIKFILYTLCIIQELYYRIQLHFHLKKKKKRFQTFTGN